MGKTSQIPYRIISSIFSIMIILSIKDYHLDPIFPNYAIIYLAILSIIPALYIVNNGSKNNNPINLSIFIICLLLISQLTFFLFSAIWSEYPSLVLQRSLIIVIPTIFITISVGMERDPLFLLICVIKYVLFTVFIISSLAIAVYIFGSIYYSNIVSYQYLNLGPLSLTQAVMGVPPVLRTGGYFGNPNALAGWASAMLPFVIALYKSQEISKLKFYVYFLAFLGAVLITVSRTGYVISFISIFLYFYIFGRSSRKIFILIIGFISLIILIVIFSLFLHESSRYSIDLSGRDDAWFILYEYFLKKPLLGYGFGVSTESALVREGIDFGAHNFYLSYLIEVGLFGFFFTISILIFLIINCYNNVRNNRNNRYAFLWGSASIVYIISTIISAFVENELYRFGVRHFLFFFIIICLSSNRFWQARKAGEANAASHRKS